MGGTAPEESVIVDSYYGGMPECAIHFQNVEVLSDFKAQCEIVDFFVWVAERFDVTIDIEIKEELFRTTASCAEAEEDFASEGMRAHVRSFLNFAARLLDFAFDVLVVILVADVHFPDLDPSVSAGCPLAENHSWGHRAN